MNPILDRISRLSQKQLLLLALEQQERIEALEARSRAPVAIVGMACRFPGGADDPQSFWNLLAEGRDAIGPIPAERWDAEAYFDADPDAPGTIAVRTGGFLKSVSGFDASFFGISQREAKSMDPQQRLLLEVAWEALENASLPPDSLCGTQTGVFVGLCNSDHFTRLLGQGDAAIDAYLASGNAPSVAAGRIAYCLGLQGPAMTIDTACSSSLVAIHLACRSIRAGESRVALACGVNVMCAPETSISLSKAHMLAPDGRCKTFDAAADGFARGEGCAVLVLKRLEDALADGDPILAVVRGTATNQDGRSGGLTVPNGPAQEAVIRAALDDAGLSPDDIDYVEAHGTGTSLGDPIEVRALAAALRKDRDTARPLLIGSVKTNIGHLESAAGIAGVVKVALALQHRRLPPHLHFRNPSPHIPWNELPIRVTDQGVGWEPGARKRRAGVSSFGFSGSNAHVILEEAPVAEPVQGRSGFHCLPLSARSQAALAMLARQAAHILSTRPGLDLSAVARQASAGRAHHPHRIAIVGDTLPAVRSALSMAATGKSHPDVRRGEAVPGQSPEVVFMFTGQGAQYDGMGRELNELYPAFRSVIDECDTLLGIDGHGRSLKQVLWDNDEALHETIWCQPALFAVEVACARLWQSFGVTPAAVIGHSLGEYAAACVAGVFTLTDGLRLVAERARLTHSLPPGGAMAAVFASPQEVAAVIRPFGSAVSIAAINADDNVVISGNAPAVDDIIGAFSARGVEARRLQISFAAHSQLVEPVRGALERAARSVPMQAPSVPIAWNRGGLSLARPDPTYWRDHLRDPVLFGDGIQALHKAGHRIFLEVGPHPTLSALAQRTVGEGSAVWLSSMRRGKPDSGEMARSLAELYVNGVPIIWKDVEPRNSHVPWPTYPFEHRMYWVMPDSTASPMLARPRRIEDPLVGRRHDTATPIYKTRLAPGLPAGIEDHRVRGQVVFPGSAVLALVQGCAADASGRQARRVEKFVFRSPLLLPDDGRIVQTELDAVAVDVLRFAVNSRMPAARSSWTLHAQGTLRAIAEPERITLDLLALQQRLGPERGVDEFLDRIAELGVALGPSFQVLGHQRSRDAEVLVQLHRPSAPNPIADIAMIDGALQAIGLAALNARQTKGLRVLREIESAWWRPQFPTKVFAYASLRESTPGSFEQIKGDVQILDQAGTVLGQFQGVTLDRTVTSAAEELCYQVAWTPTDERVFATPYLAPLPSEKALADVFDGLANQHGLAIYDELLPRLDQLSTDAVVAAFQGLGFDTRHGRTFTSAEEARSLGVVPRHAPLFRRLLSILQEEGTLSSSSLGWTVAGPLPSLRSGDTFVETLSRFQGVDGELRLLERCAGALSGVLRGEQDPLQLLFPGGSFREANAIYVASPVARTYNETVKSVLHEILSALPPEATLRVLEIGAGTGGTTRFVLPALPRERTSYTFTDVSPAFLEAAQVEFADTPFLSTALLDMERDPAEQGYLPGSFDVVIAANVLHATTDLARALHRARDLLAPGGVLLLLEGVASERWIDLTFGLTTGWWHGTDTELRPDYPLVSRASWHALLNQAGFESIVMTPEHGPGARARSQQAFIAARRVSTQRHVTIIASDAEPAASLSRMLTRRGVRTQILVNVPPDGVAGDLIHLQATALAATGFDAFEGAEKSIDLACRRPLRDLVAFARHPKAGRAWLVTRGAQSVDGDMAPGGRWQAALWGLGRVVGLEHPEHWGGLVDLPFSEDLSASVDYLVRALEASNSEDQVAYRRGRRFAARLIRSPAPEAAPVALRPDGTYLVTGGFGGLGTSVARWLAERGAGRIILAGRHPQPASEAVREIEAAGVDVVRYGLDVANEEQVAQLMRELALQGHVLRGVVHAAADLSTSLINAMSDAALDAMMRPKIKGTEIIERLTRTPERDFLVLFSSSTSLLGASRFGHYAAANAFLDATAMSAPAKCGKILTINWGTWQLMRGTSEDAQRSYRASGIEPLAIHEALDLLGRTLAGDERQLMIARLNWSKMKPLQEARRPRPFLSEVGSREAAVQRPKEEAKDTSDSLKQRLLNAPHATQDEILVDFVRGMVRATIGDDGVAPGVDIGMFDLGMDSLMALELKRRLEAGTGHSLPSTLIFNYPTIRAMAGYIGRMLAPHENGAVQVKAPVRGSAVRANPALPSSDLDQLSDDDIEARLVARLKEIK